MVKVGEIERKTQHRVVKVSANNLLQLLRVISFYEVTPTGLNVPKCK